MFRNYLYRQLIVLLCALASAGSLIAQAPKRWTSGDIHQAIRKLNFLGSALYVAAHPDDENTRLIAYLANEVKAETTYLSMTRGDGGQNLIGPEIEALLGVIRTQELLAARRIDAGRQWFTRANDFGFSKHPDETMTIWDKDEVMADVVWAIRRWQPDIIINRFDHNHDPAWDGRMHGHHTASAMLSLEAFDMAGRSDRYPEQLKLAAPWQPRRLFFNTTWWFYGSEEAFAKADKSNMVSVDIGVYYPVLGRSNTEIAAASRSMHKCQGFGATGTRGSEMEYLLLLKGDMPEDQGDLFAGINTTWTRVEGGAPIGEILKMAEAEFQFERPYRSVPRLLEAMRLMEKLPPGFWRDAKLEAIKEVIQACLGLYLEAAAGAYSATPGETVELSLEAINRSPLPVILQGVRFLPGMGDTLTQAPLDNNQGIRFKRTVDLPGDMVYTGPYWLEQHWRLGMYTVEEQAERGIPERPRAFRVAFDLMVEGTPLRIEKAVVFKRNDPVDGEVYRPFEITPPVFVNLSDRVYVFANGATQTVNVRVRAGRARVEGDLRMHAPPGWRLTPEQTRFQLARKDEEQTFSFQLTPPDDQGEGLLRPVATVDGHAHDRELSVIHYDHIPAQMVLRASQAKAVKIELKKNADQIGYIAGAGDDVPAALRQIGCQVTMINERDINPEYLRQFDAIVMGIRAYNTSERLPFYQAQLLEYVREGGTLIVQYNTNARLVTPVDELAPYRLRISRHRVTDEEAEVRFLLPDHPALNQPNVITEKDFEGWVQERGLYFPDQWDEERFAAPLSCNDPGEPPRDGGLLIAKYGSGYYVYTGLSWFRQLPAGVPGAFRLFANLISLGKEPKP